MSLIIKNSLPAERKRNLIFAENFVNAQEVRENGGRLQGDPAINFGASLDGTSDYLEYALEGTELSADDLSVVFKFIPDFAFDANAQRNLIDTTNGARYRVVKQNNASSNVLSVVFGGTTIADIASAAYGAYWNADVENILVISSTSGDTSAWLNGTKILDADATAWAKVAPTELYVGAKFDGSGPFDGTILDVKFFKVQLSDEESEDYSNGNWLDYRNNMRGDWPLDMEHHDIDNLQSLDRSGNGYHVAMGTLIVATIPKKNTDMTGYYIDGNDFFQLTTSLGISDFPFSMSIMFTTTSTGLACVMDLGDTSSSLRNMSIYLDINENAAIAMRNGGGWQAAGATPADHGNWIHAVAVFAGATDRRIYINGTLDATNVGNVAFFTPNRFSIGRFGDLTPGANIIGNIARAKVWDYALTPLQIADLAAREFKQINII